jgi:uncharacterized SAM-binding protein YcdF (DUF218 family)
MRQISIRKLIVRGLHAITAIVTSVLLFFTLVCTMVIVQSQRDETRPAGAAVVVAATSDGRATAAPLDRAMLLHRRGTIGRIILAGSSDLATAQRYLTERGVPGEAVVVSEPSATLSTRMRRVADVARTNGIDAVLMVGEPPEMLLSLKIAHDLGLIAYASPTPSPLRVNDVRFVVRESWLYVSYLFLRA